MSLLQALAATPRDWLQIWTALREADDVDETDWEDHTALSRAVQGLGEQDDDMLIGLICALIARGEPAPVRSLGSRTTGADYAIERGPWDAPVNLRKTAAPYPVLCTEIDKAAAASKTGAAYQPRE